MFAFKFKLKSLGAEQDRSGGASAIGREKRPGSCESGLKDTRHLLIRGREGPNGGCSAANP